MGILKRLGESQVALWLLLAVPAALLIFDYARDAISYGQMLHGSGEWSVRLLILTMGVTPLRIIAPRARWPLWLLRRRRAFGVATFAYALLHAVVYVVRKADFALIWDEGVQPDLATGWLALFVFAALALTSNDASLRLLRRAWKNLHRLVYAGAVLTFVHWLWIAFDIVPALIYGGILLLLEACRLLLPVLRRSRKAATSA